MASTSTKIAGAAAAALAAAGIVVAATHNAPPAPTPTTDAGVICVVQWEVGDCGDAKAAEVDGGTIDCTGGQVTVPVEQVLDPAVDAGLGATTPGFTPIPGTAVEVPCASLKRASKALTARGLDDTNTPNTVAGPCIAGHLARAPVTYPTLDGGPVYGTPVDIGITHGCGPQFTCLDPPCIAAPPFSTGTWRARLCSHRPDLCDGGVP